MGKEQLIILQRRSKRFINRSEGCGKHPFCSNKLSFLLLVEVIAGDVFPVWREPHSFQMFLIINMNQLSGCIINQSNKMPFESKKVLCRE